MLQLKLSDSIRQIQTLSDSKPALKASSSVSEETFGFAAIDDK